MDKTREIREIINSKDQIDFGNEKFITHGMLPEDLEKEYYNGTGQSYGLIGDVGAGKIIPIKDKSNFSIKGGEFTNPKYAFESKDRPTRRHHNVSELSFLDMDNCSYFTIEGVKYKGAHTDLRDTGYPNFHSSREFAHGVDIRNSENGLFKDLYFSNVPGDMLYFRKGALRPNKNISIINCTIDFNGRQGVAWGDGENILIDGLTVLNSGRGGVDKEPPKGGYTARNIIVRNSYFNTWLLPMPMGGMGIVENVLIENNEWTTGSPDTYILADRVNSFRRNIIFRGNKRLSGYGTTDGGVITAVGVEGLLIDDHYAHLKERRSLVVAFIDNCTNVTIRNSDFPNGKYIVLKDTPIEEVKVYGNVQKDLQFKIYEFDMPFKPAPDLEDFRKEGLRNSEVYQKWAIARQEWEEYNGERNSRATFKYVPVEEYKGEEPVYKNPDFIPYMGVDTVEEKPLPEPTPDTKPIPKPEVPEVKPEPTPEPIKENPVPEPKNKKWLLYVIAGIILIATLLLIVL